MSTSTKNDFRQESSIEYTNTAITEANGFTKTASAQFYVETETADLEVSQITNLNPVCQGERLSYIITAVSNGPDNAVGVLLTDFLPSMASLVSVAIPKGTFDYSDHKIIINIGDLSSKEIFTAVITVIPEGTGIITNTATLTGRTYDPVPDNNSSSIDTTVISCRLRGLKYTSLMGVKV